MVEWTKLGIMAFNRSSGNSWRSRSRLGAAGGGLYFLVPDSNHVRGYDVWMYHGDRWIGSFFGCGRIPDGVTSVGKHAPESVPYCVRTVSLCYGVEQVPFGTTTSAESSHIFSYVSKSHGSVVPSTFPSPMLTQPLDTH